jgi:hypothetical protein
MDPTSNRLTYSNLGLPPISDPVFDDLTTKLKDLMNLRQPNNLTGQVDIPAGPSLFHGSFASIYRGVWDNQQVNLLRTSANCFFSYTYSCRWL